MVGVDAFKEIIHCMRILEFLGCPAGFTVTWWRIPKKRVTAPGAFPTRAEVNGGWAFMGKPAIWVFREEEWDRVVIHECVHALAWDVPITNNTKSCLEESVGGNLVDAIFEAGTELNAEWLWSIIHSPEADWQAATWEKQRDWQVSQAGAILLRKGDKPWSEDTSVFAYYILKAAIAVQTADFLVDWLAGTIDSGHWCDYWRSYKKVFYHKALMLRHTYGTEISTRMTNPMIA